MKNNFRELEIGDEVLNLIDTYKISPQIFGLELKFSTPKYDYLRFSLNYHLNRSANYEVRSQKINFVVLADKLAKIIRRFDLPADNLGLTIFVNSKDFDTLAEKNPAIAERDVLGRIEKRKSKIIWYVQIIRLLDTTRPISKRTPQVQNPRLTKRKTVKEFKRKVGKA